MMSTLLTCASCNDQFQPSGRGRPPRFCSDACRINDHRFRARQEQDHVDRTIGEWQKRDGAARAAVAALGELWPMLSGNRREGVRDLHVAAQAYAQLIHSDRPIEAELRQEWRRTLGSSLQTDVVRFVSPESDVAGATKLADLTQPAERR